MGREILVLACLSWMSAQYVAKDAVVSDYAFEKIYRLMKEGVEMNDVCRLGFLKWCASDRTLTEEENACAEQILDELISQGKYFGFYKSLPEFFAGKYLYHDKVFLEYRTIPGGNVILSYLPVGCSEYLEQKMLEMYEGVFVNSVPATVLLVSGSVIP